MTQDNAHASHRPLTISRMMRDLIRGRYFWLLGSLLAIIVLAPLLKDYRLGIRVVDGLNALVLLTAVWVVVRSHRHLVLSLLMIVPAAAAMLIIDLRGESMPPVVVAHVGIWFFLGYVMLIILSDVLSHRHVTGDTIQGAICVYLLMSLGAAMVYSLIVYFDPEAFRIVAEFKAKGADLVFHREGFGLTVYFSLETLATIGYGDITPVSSFARSVAVLEGLAGQLYLAVLIARLVGAHLTHSGRIEIK